MTRPDVPAPDAVNRPDAVAGTEAVAGPGAVAAGNDLGWPGAPREGSGELGWPEDGSAQDRAPAGA